MDGFEIKPTLVGEHVVVRPVVAADAHAFFASLADEESRRLTGTHRSFSFDEILQWCATRAEQPDRLDLSIEDRATGSWLGELAVLQWDHNNRSCSIRIALAPGCRGRGVGTEAMRLAIDHVFSATPTHRLCLDVYDFNTRAIGVYERLGFVREGVERDGLCWDGEFFDVVLMSLLRPEWEAARRPAG